MRCMTDHRGDDDSENSCEAASWPRGAACDCRFLGIEFWDVAYSVGTVSNKRLCV